MPSRWYRTCARPREGQRQTFCWPSPIFSPSALQAWTWVLQYWVRILADKHGWCPQLLFRRDPGASSRGAPRTESSPQQIFSQEKKVGKIYRKAWREGRPPCWVHNWMERRIVKLSERDTYTLLMSTCTCVNPCCLKRKCLCDKPRLYMVSMCRRFVNVMLGWLFVDQWHFKGYLQISKCLWTNICHAYKPLLTTLHITLLDNISNLPFPTSSPTGIMLQ